LGNGDGTFAAPLIPNVDSADGINAFGVGDFNGDGITDLLVDDEDTGELTVLLGKGDGTFTVGQSMPFNTQSIAVADFNGDGKLDLALSRSAQTTILLGNGDGTFFAKYRIKAHGYVCSFDQKKPQKAITLFADPAHPLFASRRVLARNQSQIASNLFAAREAANISNRQDEGECCYSTHSRLAHQQLHVGVLPGHLRHCIVQLFPLIIQHAE
jgi:hypothetical protein